MYRSCCRLERRNVFMNIAAYCRVSTEKEDQLNSLEAQKNFFKEYTDRSGDRLVKLYADEGLSGTKIKNRKQFLKMMTDAENGLFDMVVVKDISRFARNTVDLLQNIRKLKSLGIETQFLTANMTSMGNSEFVLTVFGALAQEESANTSKRVKFGKKINAEKGRVPNLVFGYDKTAGDYFNLTVNKTEAAVIRQIYGWYLNSGYGAAKIASMLNARGIRTKRGCEWSQNAVCRILENEIYTGKIINGKEEVADFLTGRRTSKSREDWYIAVRPDLRIISDEEFAKAGLLKAERGKKFKTERERHSSRHLFSTLIKCKDCGWSFRRSVRTYKNTYIRWVCSGHNRGADSCPNAVSVDENELVEVIEQYFSNILSKKKNAVEYVVNEFQKLYRAGDENAAYEKELRTALERLKRSRQKYMDMYDDDLITRDELNAKIGRDRQEMERLHEELKIVEQNLAEDGRLHMILSDTFREIEDFCNLRAITNAQLRRVIDKIEVDRSGNVEIFLRSFGKLEIDKTVRICDGHTQGSHREAENCQPRTLSSGEGAAGYQ